MNVIPELAGPRLAVVLLHFLWQGALIAILLPAVVAALRLTSANSRYACSLTAFALMALAPLATLLLTSPPRPEADAAAPRVTAEINEVVPESPPIAAMSEPAATFTSPEAVVFPSTTFDTRPIERVAPPTPAAAEPSPPRDWMTTLEPWVIRGWMLGVVALSLRMLAGLLGIRRWRKGSQPLPVELASRVGKIQAALELPSACVRISTEIGEAMAVGLLRPMVLLPASWVTELPADMLEAVIAHELAHLRRYDLWVNLMQRVVETLLFYHPAVWWLSRRLRIERELCCDALAVTATCDRVRYVETLEHVARLRLPARPALAVAMASSRRVLLHRVRQLLGVGPQPSRQAWLAGLVTLLVVAVATAGIYGTQASELASSGQASADQTSEEDSTREATDPNNSADANATDVAPDNGPRILALKDKDLKSAERRFRLLTRARQKANKKNLDKPNSVSKDELERMRLEIELAKAEVEIWQAENNEDKLPDLQLRYCEHATRLAVHNLQVALQANQRRPGQVSPAELQRLRERAQVRWGLPQGGLQIGLELLSPAALKWGDAVEFRMRVRNVSSERKKTKLHYRPAEQVTFRLFGEERISIGMRASKRRVLDIDLAPGEHIPVPRTSAQLDSSELQPGRYDFIAQPLWRHGESDNLQELTQVRGPSSRYVPVDLPLGILLASEPKPKNAQPDKPIDVAKAGYDVAWGVVRQGLQGGVRYARGLQHPSKYDHPDNWSWNADERVRAEILVRNVTDSAIKFSYVPGLKGDLLVVRPGAHSVTRYDHMGALQRRRIKGSRYLDQEESDRRIEKTLQPGASVVVGRTSFIVKKIHPDRRHRYEDEDLILVEPGKRYRFKTRPRIKSDDGGVTIDLPTGGLPLWIRSGEPKPEEKPLDGKGVGRLSLAFDLPDGPTRTEVVIQRLRPLAEKSIWRRTLRNGADAVVQELPAGEYSVAREILLKVANIKHTELCDRQVVSVKRDSVTRVNFRRDGKLGIERHTVKGFAEKELPGGFITVHRAAEGDWNTGEPARAYDFRVERDLVCATTCDTLGRYTLEPLPAGRYLVVVRAFRPRTGGQLATGSIQLPHFTGCQNVRIYTDRGERPFFSRFPSELELWPNWNHPQWQPNGAAEKVGLQEPRPGGPPVDAEIAGLMRQVESKNKQVRGDAIVLLGKLGKRAEPAVPLLIDQLAETNLWVDVEVAGPRIGSAIAGHAERALVAIGEPAVVNLGVAMRHRNVEIARRAALSLGQIKSSASIPALVDALGSPDRQVAGHASSALGKIGRPALDALLEALRSDVPQRRNYAAAALGGTRLPQSIEPLIAAIETGDDDAQLWATYALAKFKTPDSRPILARPVNVKKLINALKTDQVAVHSSVAGTLAFVANDAKDLLLPALSHEDRRVREGITVAVSNLQDERLIGRLLKEFNNGSGEANEQARAKALRALRRQLRDVASRDAILPALLRGLKDESHNVRQAAADVLLEAAHRFPTDRRAVAPLIAAMRIEPESYALFQMIQTLGTFADAKSVDPLLAILKRDEVFQRNGDQPRAEMSPQDIERRDEDLRAQVCYALAETGDRRAIPVLRKRLDRDEPAVIEALGRLGDHDSLEAYLKALQSRDPKMKRAAATALTHSPDENAIPQLVNELNRAINLQPRGGDFDLSRRISEALAATGSPEAAELLVVSLRQPFVPNHRGDFLVDKEMEREFQISEDPRARPLTELGEAALPALLRELRRNDARVPVNGRATSRAIAAWALYEMVIMERLDAASPKLVSTLAGVLQDGDPDVRVFAAKTLGWLQADSAVDALTLALKAEQEASPRILKAMLNALGHIGAPSKAEAAAAFLKHEATQVRIAAVYAVTSAEHPRAADLLHKVLEEDAVAIQVHAARQLGFVGNEQSASLLAKLLTSEPNERVRENAIQALGMLGDRSKADVLAPFSGEKHSEKLQTRAAFALVQMKDERGLASLRRLLSHEDAKVRERAMTHAAILSMFAAAGSGVKLEFPAARTYIQEVAINDPSVRVRRYGAEALRGFSDSQTVDALLKLANDKSPAVREAALRELSATTDRRRRGALQRALADPAGSVRARAAAGFADSAPTEAPQELAKLLNDDEVQVRLAVLKAAGKIGAKQLAEPIQQLGDADPNPQVRRLAQRILQQLAE